MRRRELGFSILATAVLAIGLAGAAQAAGRPLCRPTLVFTDVQFSPVQPPTMERRWSATVSVDASRCVANSAGYFEILFARLKETAPEVDFRAEFMWFSFDWLPPAVRVEVDFAADEAVEGFRFDTVTPCPCRE
jgi:hypothetical protein